jgi:hypothetical protein
MRRAVLGFAIALAAGLVALGAVGVSRGSSLVYSDGVNPAIAVAVLDRGDRVCQAPLRPPRGSTFDRVGFLVASSGKPGPAMRVEVYRADTRRHLGTGRLEGGYPDLALEKEHLVPVGRIHTDAPLRVCVISEGPRRTAIVGQAGIASPSTSGTLNGTKMETDVTINLHRDESSLLALLPDMAERAARFRAGWVTPVVYLLLAFAIVVAAPLLLARGIGRAAAADGARD